MIEIIITSSVLITIIVLIRFILMGRINPRVQYAIWGLVLLRLLLPVSLLSSPVSVMNIVPSSASGIVSFFGTTPQEAYLNSLGDNINTLAQNAAYSGGSPLPMDSSQNASDAEAINDNSQGNSVFYLTPFVQTLLLIAWISGTVLIALYLILLNLRFQRKLNKNAVQVEAPDCPLPVYKAEFLHSPCLIGFFKPRIYLTESSMRDELTLHHIITHELCHYAHKDNWWSLLRGLCLSAYWFDPFVWLAAILSRQDCELSCDEAAIIRLGESERFSYGKTLLSLVVEKTVTVELFSAATTMTSGSRGLKERIKLIAKKPKMTVVIAVLVILAAVAAVCLTFTHGSNTVDTISDKGETTVGQTQPNKQGEAANQTQLSKTDEIDTTVNGLLDEILSAGTVTVEYDKKGSSGTNSGIKTKKLGTNDRGNYKDDFFFSKGWKVISAQDATNEDISGGEKISIYDDKGHRFSLTQGSYIVSYTDGTSTVYYKASTYVGDAMISNFARPTEEERQRWDADMKEKEPGPMYVDDMDSKNYKAVGTTWAQARLKQYMSLSKDHPCYSDNGSVINVELIGVSAINHPRSITFRITLSLHPANGKLGFYTYYVGGVSGDDGENVLMEREVVLEKIADKQWTFKEMGTGGYAGWGYSWPPAGDTETMRAEYDEIQKSIESRKGDFTDMEWVLMRLSWFNWSEYTKLYGSSAANSLMDCIEGKAFGSDQEIRTIYILEGVPNLTDEIRPRYVSLLKKLQDTDKALFDRCVEECDNASIVREVMKDS